MTDSYTRICFLLAAAGFREKELADFAVAVKEANLGRFVGDVVNKRSIIAAGNHISRAEESHVEKRERSQADYFASKVYQLLVEEAHMTKSQASEALRTELRKFGRELPPLGKRGFNEWLQMLSRILPPSEILHLSTRIRNKHVHLADTDWPLK